MAYCRSLCSKAHEERWNVRLAVSCRRSQRRCDYVAAIVAIVYKDTHRVGFHDIWLDRGHLAPQSVQARAAAFVVEKEGKEMRKVVVERQL